MPTDLLTLYNNQFVDLVRATPGGYEPVKWPKHATHELIGTRWNREHNPLEPDNVTFATAVCAVPLHTKHKHGKVIVRAGLTFQHLTS